MRIIITGISGFLGPYLVKHKPSNATIIGIYHQNRPTEQEGVIFEQLDLTKIHLAETTLQHLRPDAIWHVAALSNPNVCEQNPSCSEAINFQASVALATIAHKLQIPFLFTSTDLVFEGTSQYYQPLAAKQPLMVYGKHKSAAEDAILALYPSAIVVRLPLLFGFPLNATNNFLAAWLNKLKAQQQVSAFTDEYRTAASADCAAKGLWLLLQKEVRGVWHLGGKERLSRFEFIRQAAQHFGLDTAQIRATTQAKVTMPAARPADVSLDSSASFQIGYHPLTLEEVLSKHPL